MERESDQHVALFNVFDFTTHTLGSNSTLGPSVVELITFAAISWSIIVLIVILVPAALFCCKNCKQSIKRCVLMLNLELYSQTTWEDLILFQPWTQCFH